MYVIGLIGKGLIVHTVTVMTVEAAVCLIADTTHTLCLVSRAYEFAWSGITYGNYCVDFVDDRNVINDVPSLSYAITSLVPTLYRSPVRDCALRWQRRRDQRVWCVEQP